MIYYYLDNRDKIKKLFIENLIKYIINSLDLTLDFKKNKTQCFDESIKIFIFINGRVLKIIIGLFYENGLVLILNLGII